ncbi:MAG TPA: N-acetylneuraminate synthase family protein [Acidobacteriaceae bacterium]|jgi:N-acetylneuraminate synthase|nr:N-acetylneuraminate synthase family protein [Acidobacteriaceae bacterium]
MSTVRIANRPVGDGQPCFIIAEIGINHNGDMDLAKRLIRVAVASGCDAVKFQKRTPELCVPPAQRNLMRETPWGYISYMEYREKVEFGLAQYEEIDRYCREQDVLWFASCWDEPSVDFLQHFDPPCYKIASASLTNDALLRHTRATGKPLLMSTGMSSLPEIDHAVEVVGKDNLILLHTVSTYPAKYDELNLRAIITLRDRYGVPVGYSGHETGIASTVATVALGACCVERHITLDRAMWGSDHAASLEPTGLTRICRDIRLVETSMGSGQKKVLERELPIIARLRGQN